MTVDGLRPGPPAAGDVDRLRGDVSRLRRGTWTKEERRVVVDAIAPQESVAGLAAEWEVEIARRAELVRTGQSVGKPAAEVFDRLEARLRAR